MWAATNRKAVAQGAEELYSCTFMALRQPARTLTAYQHGIEKGNAIVIYLVDAKRTG